MIEPLLLLLLLLKVPPGISGCESSEFGLLMYKEQFDRRLDNTSLLQTLTLIPVLILSDDDVLILER